MTTHRVWFSSAEEVTVHITGCPRIENIYDENVIDVWIEVDYDGSLPPGMKPCGVCGGVLEQRAKSKRKKLAAEVRERIRKYNKPLRWFR